MLELDKTCRNGLRIGVSLLATLPALLLATCAVCPDPSLQGNLAIQRGGRSGSVCRGGGDRWSDGVGAVVVDRLCDSARLVLGIRDPVVQSDDRDAMVVPPRQPHGQDARDVWTPRRDSWCGCARTVPR